MRESEVQIGNSGLIYSDFSVPSHPSQVSTVLCRSLNVCMVPPGLASESISGLLAHLKAGQPEQRENMKR